MAQDQFKVQVLYQQTKLLSNYVPTIIFSGLFFCCIALFIESPFFNLSIFFFGAISLWLGIFIKYTNFLKQISENEFLRAFKRILQTENRPSLLTDSEGQILNYNTPLKKSFDLKKIDVIENVLRNIVACPEKTSTQLISNANRFGTADLKTHDTENEYEISIKKINNAYYAWNIAIQNKAIDQDLEAQEISPAPHGSEPFDYYESLPIAILKVSQEGYILAKNSSAKALLSIENQSQIRLSELIDGLGRPINEWLKDAASGRVQKAEFVRSALSNDDTIIQISLSKVIEANGDSCILAVLTDATKLKSLEAQFVQSQKMHAIGQLSGGIAHDFNNLLTAISGHCDLLLLPRDEGDPDYSDLIQINQNANRAASLVKQLLAFSRKQTMSLESCDLRNTISDLTHLLNRLVGEKVKLKFEHGKDLANIWADKRQIEQVLMNLVVNACDAMPNGGDVKIKTKNVTFEKMHPRENVAIPPGDYVEVKVSDEGMGIPKEKIQKVFEPFYTTKGVGEGTGLGLSTVYGIIKQTGGYIFIDSEVDKGTVFTLFLPTHADNAKKPSNKKLKQKNSRLKSNIKAGTVLLVEDEAPVRAFTSRALQMHGFNVLEADSAEMALKTLADNNTEIDIFISDVIMPGMDGPTWVKKAMEQHPDVKVIFVSGYAEEQFIDQKKEIKNSVFLPKPFTLSELIAAVEDQLKEKLS